MDNKDAKRPSSSDAEPLAEPLVAEPLAEQGDALGFYLDSLLMDLPEAAPEGMQIDTQQKAQETLPEQTVEKAQERSQHEQKEESLQVTAEQPSELRENSLSQNDANTNAAGKAATSSLSLAQSSLPQGVRQRPVARESTPRQRGVSASVIPLDIKRNELPRRPFAEPPSPQALLAAPPVLPLLMRDVPEPTLDATVAPVEVREATPQETPPEASPINAPATDKHEPLAPDVAETIPAVASASVDTPALIDTSDPAVTPAAILEAQLAAAKSNVPEWAQNRFQCLSFTVAGLTLAAPLEKLHGIVEWHAEITELPGYASWFMGLLQNRGANVRVIDAAQIIMPDGRRPDARPVLERIKYVVLIDDGRWGLAVDSIGQVLTMDTDSVRWRGERSKRPWLAGTAIEQMCAVLDIGSLSEQLVQGLKLDD